MSVAVSPDTIPHEGVPPPILAVNIPRPCVAAASSPSEALYCNISVLVFGKVGSGFQTVDVPLSRLVCHTPVSVAMIAFVLSPG